MKRLTKTEFAALQDYLCALFAVDASDVTAFHIHADQVRIEIGQQVYFPTEIAS